MSAGILAEFGRNHGELARSIGRLRGVDAEKTMITSPVSAIGAYSLADAFRIIALHEQVDILQARRVMAMEGFPEGIGFPCETKKPASVSSRAFFDGS